MWIPEHELPVAGIPAAIAVPVEKPFSRTIDPDFATASRHDRHVSGNPEYESLIRRIKAAVAIAVDKPDPIAEDADLVDLASRPRRDNRNVPGQAIRSEKYRSHRTAGCR